MPRVRGSLEGSHGTQTKFFDANGLCAVLPIGSIGEDAEARQQRSHARHIAIVFSSLVRAPQHDSVDRCPTDPRMAVHQPAYGNRGQLLRAPGRPPPGVSAAGVDQHREAEERGAIVRGDNAAGVSGSGGADGLISGEGWVGLGVGGRGVVGQG